MVDNVGDHRQDQIAGRGRTQTLEGHADGDWHKVAAAETCDDAAHGTQQHKAAADQTLTELVGQRHHKNRSHGHRDSAHDAQQALGGAPCVRRAEESVVQNPFAEVAHGAVLHRAAPLEQHIERHDDPPHAVAGNGLELLAQRGGLGRGLGVGAPFLGDALTGEEELQVDGQCAEDGDGQHGEEPQVLVLLQREGNEHREYHRAAAHNAQTRHVGEGSQRAALFAVTGGNGDHRGVGGVVDGVGHGVIEVIRNGDPNHLGHALKGHDEHQHACHGQRQRREQNPGACLTGQGLGALDQLADDEVGRHDQHRGNQLQGRQEAEIQFQDIGKVVLQNAGEDARGKQCAERADKVAQQHFRHLDVVAGDTGLRQRRGPEVGFRGRHDRKSLLLCVYKQFVYVCLYAFAVTVYSPLASTFSSPLGSTTVHSVPTGTATVIVISPSAIFHAALITP